MVEITYQMVLSTLQTIALIVGIYYYVMTLNYTRKNQQQQLETRQAQLLTQFATLTLSTDFVDQYMEVLNWEWDDYHDFEMKYGSDNNLEAYAKRTRIWGFCNYIGKYLREGLIDIDLVYTLTSDTAIFQWYKWRDVIEEQRRRYYTPDFVSDWEYLVAELLKYKEKLGYSWEPPETFGRYIPDQ
jgi:hypothetical protein